MSDENSYEISEESTYSPTTIEGIQRLLHLSDETIDMFRATIRNKDCDDNIPTSMELAHRMAIEIANSNMSPDILRALLAQLARLV